MANNRKDEAWELIRKAAQMNGVSQSKDLEMLQVKMHICLGSVSFAPKHGNCLWFFTVSVYHNNSS